MEELNKKQKLTLLLLVTSFGGVFGWVYEFIFYFFNDGKFSYQGGNFLPWINIYAIGGLLVLLATNKIKKNPLKVFLVSTLVTGLLEFLSGFIIYKVFNQRFWDYNVEILNFGNIGGYICLRSVLFFGISSLMLIYFVEPIFIKPIKKYNTNTLFKIALIICLIFIIDELYNLVLPKLTSLPSANKIYKNIGIK